MMLALALDLTLKEIVVNIPHDGPSVLVYGILALFGGVIWLGSRGRPAADDRGGE